jgi:hypothetical protein
MLRAGEWRRMLRAVAVTTALAAAGIGVVAMPTAGAQAERRGS